MISGGEEIGSASEAMAVELITAGTPFTVQQVGR